MALSAWLPAHAASAPGNWGPGSQRLPPLPVLGTSHAQAEPAGNVPQSRTEWATQLGLQPRADGGYSYDGGDRERFRAHISRNGKVQFWTDPKFSVKLQRNCALAACPSTQVRRSKIAADRERLQRRLRRASQVAGTVLSVLLANAAENMSPSALSAHGLGEDPAVRMGNGSLPVAPGLNGPVPPPSPGAVAPYRLAFGYLPAPTAEQQAFLDRSFEFRLELAIEDRLRRFDRAVIRLMDELAKLEQDQNLAAHQKKARLLTLWSSVDWHASAPQDSQDFKLAQRLPKQLDRTRARKAKRARRQIMHFACRVFDPKGPQTFTSAELASLSEQRASGLEFRPTLRGCRALAR